MQKIYCEFFTKIPAQPESLKIEEFVIWFHSSKQLRNVFPELVKVSCFGVGCEKIFMFLRDVLIANGSSIIGAYTLR
jgi:hypothetical protein